jgi:exodeoxyribonuclease VII small subunit
MAKSESKSYSVMQAELDEVLAALQSDVDIDRAIELYEKAQKLITELESYLKTAKNKVEKVQLKFQ